LLNMFRATMCPSSTGLYNLPAATAYTNTRI